MDKEWKPGNQAAPIKTEKQAKPERTEHHAEPKKISPKVWYVTGGVVLVLILLFAFLIPAFKGYSVYQAMKASGAPDTYITDMKSLENAKAALEQQLNQSAEDLAAKLAEITSCQQSAASCNSNLSSLNSQIAGLQNDIKNKQLAMNALDQDLQDRDAAISDAARRICCVKKVDDPTINSYSLVNSKIACASNGTTSISC